MRLRNIAIGPLPCQWGENHPRNKEKGKFLGPNGSLKIADTYATLPDSLDFFSKEIRIRWTRFVTK
jgi:hypothetical protein